MTAQRETAEECYRLSRIPGGRGLHCEAGGVSLGGVALLCKTSKGLAPRPPHEIEALIKGAYGQGRDLARLTSGLQVAADALDKGDVSRAMIAALHLRLPDLDDDSAALIARVDDILAKYDPNEPRDWRGRWTTGGTGSAPAGADRPRRPTPDGPVGQRRQAAPAASSNAASRNAGPAASERSWNSPVHLYGGNIIPIAGGPGSNFPPEDERDEEIPPPEPDFNASKVPQGWDQPGHRAGGLEYKPSRNPTLDNGEPWPEAKPEQVLAVLRLQTGRRPFIYVFVPRDGIGPMLLGSTTQEQDLREPEGYDRVMFIGRPQFTSLGNGESPHALESVVEGLRLASSNRFSKILFNSTLSTIAREVEPAGSVAVESLRRPDVAAIVRPLLDLPYRVEPWEILSGRQTILVRRDELPKDVPGIKLIEGRTYKSLEGFDDAWFEQLGVRRLCL